MDPILLAKLELTQGRLKQDGVKLNVVCRKGSNKLYLRGQLPNKNDPSKISQQFIPLNLEVTALNIKEAEQVARYTYKSLKAGLFDWTQFNSQDTSEPEELKVVQVWIEDFKNWWWRKPKRKQETWDKEYQQAFDRLDARLPLEEAIRKGIRGVQRETGENSRTTRRRVLALKRLAEFADLDPKFVEEIRDAVGTYDHTKAEKRFVPTDQEIANCRIQIKNPTHRWMYGMLATYGLRNHELWYVIPESLQIEHEGVIEIGSGGKTKSRIVWPLYPEWYKRWELYNIPNELPGIHLTTNSQRGNVITKIFSRNNIPFTPYALRDAYTLRTLAFHIEDTLASELEGHSPEIRRRSYLRHMERRHHQIAFSQMLGREVVFERPQPPPDPEEQVLSKSEQTETKRVSRGITVKEAAQLTYVKPSCCGEVKGRWRGWATSKGKVWGKRWYCYVCSSYQTVAGIHIEHPQEQDKHG